MLVRLPQFCSYAFRSSACRFCVGTPSSRRFLGLLVCFSSSMRHLSFTAHSPLRPQCITTEDIDKKREKLAGRIADASRPRPAVPSCRRGRLVSKAVGCAKWSIRMVGTIVTAVLVIAAIVTILSWLGFAPSGPHILAGIKVRIQAPSKEREELRKQVKELQKKTDDQATQIVDLMNTTRMQGASITQLGGRVKNDLQADVARLERRVVDLEVVVKESELDGKPLYRTPEAQRVRQAGKAALKRDDK